MKGNKSEINKYFYYLSRLTIIVPIVIIILAFFIKTYSVPNDKGIAAKLPTPVVTGGRKFDFDGVSERTASQEGVIDLQGPLICSYSDKESSGSAFIKGKKIFFRSKTSDKETFWLIKGDCIYTWEKDKFSGEKSCGISPYIDVIDQLSKLNLFDSNSLLNYLPELWQEGLATSEGVYKTNKTNLTTICKKEEVNDKIFDLPKNILFKKTVAPTSTKK